MLASKLRIMLSLQLRVFYAPPCMKSADIGVAMRIKHAATLSLARPAAHANTVAVLEERHSTAVELEYLNPNRVVPTLTFSTSSFLLSLARGKGELSK